MGHEPFGGTEFFFSNQQELATTCIAHMEEYNNALLPIFKSKAFLTGTDPSALGTRGISSAVALPNEGQIDPGKTMFSLLQLAHQLGVIVLSGCGVLALSETPTAVSLQTDVGDVKAQFVQVCTNGFAQQLFPILDGQPARAQVVVTSPIPNLPYKGVFHLDRGYYYFRNIGNRLLLGGGRHLDFKAERTFSLETSERLMSHLKELLEQYLLPKFNFSIEHQWAGTMGFGSSNEKEVLTYPLSERIRCNVRLGGMGVALSAHVAEQAAQATPSI